MMGPMTAPAAEAPDQCVAEGHQPFRDAAGGHELRGEHEQRNRQQHEAVVHAVAKLFGGSPRIETGQEEIENRPADHRVADRQSEQAEGDDRRQGQGERAGGIHGPGSLPRSECHRIQT
jgi:hypothetical protein